LTGLGCRLAKLLEAGPSDQLQRENVRDVDVVDVTPPHTKLLEVRGAPDPRESPPTVAVRGKPPEYLTSYREICKAVGRDASDVELIKRLNRQYGGPIQPGKKGKRPFVVKSEFLAWWETLAERMNASDSAGESQQKPTAGVKIGKDTIQTFPEESMHEKKRRSDFSGS
jgi:hypothetical protein